jgi:hypothetical protein
MKSRAGSWTSAHAQALGVAERMQGMALSQIDAQYTKDEKPSVFEMSLDDYVNELDRLGEDGFNAKYRPILQGIIDQMFTEQEAQ